MVVFVLELWFNERMSTSEHDVDKLIHSLGGDVAAAAFWEVTRQAVAKFRREKRIPNARLLHLKVARPDLFDSELRAGIDRRDLERRELDSEPDCDLGDPRDGDRRQDDRRGNCDETAA